ncbi:MAG: HAD-IB family phosphatase [Gammaproteobacteria bacterium]|nr:HAD-IB family phosphatase [Gammaproteobacteria bacterium]
MDERVALFDLDGTLTWRDTFLPYVAGYWLRHPRRWLRVWRVLPALAIYWFRDRDRGALKARVIRCAMGGADHEGVRAWTAAFVRGLPGRRAYRPAALARLARHRDAGDVLILMSASPDLYVPAIGAALGVARTICTELRWSGDRLDGALASPNRRGEEKRRCLDALRVEYPGRAISAYGNGVSDLAHLRAADHGVLVNGSRAARRAARAAGLDTEHWD